MLKGLFHEYHVQRLVDTYQLNLTPTIQTGTDYNPPFSGNCVQHDA